MALPIYSDVNADDPNKGLLKTNVDAVISAMDHLFSTERDEIPFFLDFTADLDNLLFRDLSVETALGVYSLVASALERFEPRVVLDESRSTVDVNDDEDGYDIVLSLSIRGFEGSDTVYKAFVARQD